jgi:hypothetical protein
MLFVQHCGDLRKTKIGYHSNTVGRDIEAMVLLCSSILKDAQRRRSGALTSAEIAHVLEQIAGTSLALPQTPKMGQLAMIWRPPEYDVLAAAGSWSSHQKCSSALWSIGTAQCFLRPVFVDRASALGLLFCEDDRSS